MDIDEFTIVAVLGRPSADTSEFFNSVKFSTYEVEARSMSEALENDPLGRPEVREALGEGYQVLNWYAFKKERKD